ncbi:MAG TPA: hypothetical protein VF250_03190, partial [Conexibacter sp.]
MRLSLLVVVAGCVLALGLPAVAPARTSVDVKIKPNGVVNADGTAAVTVTVRCTLGPGDRLIPSIVVVSQPDGFGSGA